jgi:hypothetical protein
MDKNLLEKANKLGIENAESYTVPQLKKIIEAKEKDITAFSELKLKADGLGIVYPEDITQEVLNELVLAAEDAIESQRIVDEFNEKSHVLIEATIGYDNFEKFSVDEISEGVKTIKLFSEKAKEFIEGLIDFGKFEILSVEDLIASVKSNSELSEIEVVSDGKTDKTYKAKNGIEYGFSATAPASFRFAGFVKNQSEWIEDLESMDLMVSGNLSYVKPLKK